MTFWEIYLYGLLLIMAMMTMLWIVSILINNVSIVDLFWGFGFVLSSALYFSLSEGFELRKIILLHLVLVGLSNGNYQVPI